MLQEKPLVTIVIPSHNRPEMLSRAVGSVLNQTYNRLEVIIVDDHSDKKTLAVGSALAEHQQVKLLKSPGTGACAARNFGIKNATGEFVTGLDDDDLFTPRRVEKLFAAYDEEYAFVAARSTIFTENHIPDVDEEKGRVRFFTLKRMLDTNRIGNQVFARKERFLEVGGFDEALSARQDYDLWVRLVEKYGKAKIITNILYLRNENVDYKRISRSKSRERGLLQFYNKHNHKMTFKQRVKYLSMLSAVGTLEINLSQALISACKPTADVEKLFNHL